jgi:16S rRNA (uracil1498-N3)-methyltransferase
MGSTPHFVTPATSLNGGYVTIHGIDARHMRTALRLEIGDTFTVAVERQGRFLCRIESIDTETVVGITIAELPVIDSNAPAIVLYQAIPKKRKMDDIVRMSAELGALRVTPILTKRCDVQLTGEDEPVARKMDRWRAIAHAAAKQSGSDQVMIIDNPTLLEKINDSSTLKIVLWEEETVPLKTVLSEVPEAKRIALLIGPEGGLTQGEIMKLRGKGFVPASLGARILRTETAPVATIASILYHYSG